MIMTALLEKGGIVMVLILLLSVYVVAVIMYKMIQFGKYHLSTRHLVRDVLVAMHGKRYSDALKIAIHNRSSLATVIEVTLRGLPNHSMAEDKKIRLIEASGSRELRAFESHLRGLEMVAAIAPLLGLLGTVIGMVKAFAGIGEGGSQVDPSVLAGGIWEALLNTVAGLSVAIPALAAYYVLDSQIERIRSAMKDAVSSVFTMYEELARKSSA